MIETSATATHFLGMPPAHFLRDYWQQKPLLVRNAFAGFTSPLAADDLGGLACEEYALSRLITRDPVLDQWNVRSGPFAEADFSALPASHWTLLVQDVDKWDADVAALLDHFDFLPSWRVDDVMVSYAEDGGSVGAHVDQYDVFLIQGLGQRRWQISTDAEAPMAFRDDVDLKLLREFKPTHDWLLEPGDMLYLPPGVAHHGVAEGECLTFSVGMRAPAVAEMITDFAGFLAERMTEEWRYADAGITPAKHPGEIDDGALEKIEQTLRESLALDASLLRHWFGSFITRYRAAHEAVPRSKPIGKPEFARRLEAGAGMAFNPWTRWAWSKTARGATLFVAGEAHACSRNLALRICTRAALQAHELAAMDDASLELLRTLTNAGHLALSRTRSRS